jgi:hypothetical protein
MRKHRNNGTRNKLRKSKTQRKVERELYKNLTV